MLLKDNKSDAHGDGEDSFQTCDGSSTALPGFGGFKETSGLARRYADVVLFVFDQMSCSRLGEKFETLAWSVVGVGIVSAGSPGKGELGRKKVKTDVRLVTGNESA